MMVTLRTSGGSPAVVDADAGEQLAGLSGSLLTPDSPGYDEARTIWNAMIDRRPGLIVQCADANDVARAVRFARAHDLLVAVRGGGHNIAGNAVCDGGLMIDLSPMRTVRVDQAARTARVGAGATLGDVDRTTQGYGLATPLGVNSTTGIAGLTLGGGFGWLSRRLGLTIDNLLSAEVVTAEGEIVRASARENPDLFWAIRGGGGNFGIVTSFEFQLHPVGPEVLSGLVVHPLGEARDVLRFYRDFLPTTPEAFSCWFVLRQAPPLPFLAPEWHGKPILALAMCWSGELAEGERVAAPLRSFGKPLADVVAPNPYADWQTALDPLLTPGFRNYWKSHDFLRAERRAHRRAAGVRRAHSRSEHRDRLRAGGGCGLPGAIRRHGVHPSRRAVRDERARPLDGPGQGPGLHRLGARPVPGGDAVRDRGRVRELPDRGGRRSGAGGLRLQLRAAGGAQEPVRPDEPVPDEPEHPAVGTRVAPGVRGGETYPERSEGGLP